MFTIYKFRRTATKNDNSLWVLIFCAIVSLLLAISVAQAQEAELFCPEDYPECFPFDFSDELERAHLLDPTCAAIGARGNSDRRRRIQRWEIQAIEIITSGAIGKSPIDVIPTDGGAHGFAHFQPPNDLSISWMEFYEDDDDILECIQTDDFHQDSAWVEDIYDILYSRYSIAIQLNAWRSGVRRSVRAARQNGWEEEHWAVAASIANSTGTRGFINLAESADWDPERTIQAYTDQRPDSRHRQRRATMLRRLL